MSLFRKNQATFPMSRAAFVLLISSVVLSIIPHVQRVPPWLLVIFIVVIHWRVQIFRQRAKFPSRWIRMIIVLMAMGSVLYQHGTIIGPEAGVGLLIAAYCLKLLEMVTRRDAYIVIVLSYFVLATTFLFGFSLWLSLYVIGVVILVTSVLVALNNQVQTASLWLPLKTAARLILFAIPLTLCLFYFFPRMGPMWDFSFNGDSVKTGLSENMTPGDISNLSKSDDLVFRVRFNGRIPAPEERYWRALVFDHYDGQTWHAVKRQSVTGPAQVYFNKDDNANLEYEITMEASNQHWLMSIPYAEIEGLDYQLSPELMARSVGVLDQTTTYRVKSYPDFSFEPERISSNRYDQFTLLPSGNPRARRFALEQYRAAGNRPQVLVENLLRWFNQEEFFYTLSPPPLTNDRVDGFLFDTQQGFCAHYAAATVFMLRSVGIPARLIGGYQGGEMSPYGDYMLVHQYDAHAWAEYWVAEHGWVRIDPTNAVAPSRILSGARSTVADWELNESPLASSNLRNNRFLSQVRLLLDYADYLWIKNVVTFNKDNQSQLLESLLGKVNPGRLALLMLLVIGSCLLFLFVVIVVMGSKSKSISPANVGLSRLLKKLEKINVQAIQPGETAAQYCDRAAKQHPALAQQLTKFSYLYSKIEYSNGAGEQDDSESRLSDSNLTTGKNNPERELLLMVKSIRLRGLS